MRGCPLASVFPLTLTVALAGCGLSAVGPDLDAWQAHQAALAAQDGVDSADTVGADGPDAGDAATDQATAADVPDPDGGGVNGDDVEVVLGDALDADTVGDDGQEVGEDAADAVDATDVTEVDVGVACKIAGDCPPPPDLCQIPACVEGLCKLSPKACPPGTDACDLSVCATATGSCNFASAPTGTTCDDLSPCSKASACDSSGGCVASDKAGCDDGNPCTFDECVAGGSGPKCASGPPVAENCDDGNSCTSDSCGVGKCVSEPLPNATDCSDGNACTTGDLCAGGKCNAGVSTQCGTGTVCKPVSCQPTVGCTSPADGAPDGTPCKDPGGVCSSGSCIQGWTTALITGPNHACAWAGKASVACWGSNFSFALGPAPLASSPTPTLWTLINAEVQSVAVGGGFACRADKGVGKLVCRGENDHGQLGQTPGAPSATDVAVPLFLEWTQVVAGNDHVCALTSSGKVHCWGAGTAGQLGKAGQLTDASGPVEVSFAGNFAALAAGGNNTCGLVNGEAYCWGSNGVAWANPLANPKAGVPAAVKATQTFVALAVGDNHACGLTKVGGEVWCWGKNDSFQLGVQDQGATLAKLPIASLQSVAVGNSHTCVVSTAGAVSCFGSNAKLQKGPGSKAVPDDPNLAFLLKAKAVSAAGDATCVLMANLSVLCFGVGPDGAPTLPYVVPGSVGPSLD